MKKWFKRIGIAFGAFFILYVGFIAWFLNRALGVPDPRIAEEHPAARGRVLELTKESDSIGREILTRVAQTGTTRVPYGQFYSGTQGWVGLKGIWNMGLGGREFQAPVRFVIITHPREGVILVDTGISPAQTRADYYSPAKDIDGNAWKPDENQVTEQESAPARLREIGLRVEDVKHIIITHLHEDHVGGLRYFPGARVHLSALEWAGREVLNYGPSFDMVKNWNHFEFDSGRFHSFAAAKDLFGDGTIILLPAFGHTSGHTGVFINMGAARLYVTGDGLYTLRHLDAASIASFNQYGEEGLRVYQDSARRVRDLQKAVPNLALLPLHDPFAYGEKLLTNALNDGRLSAQEVAALRAHQATLFEADGTLKAAAKPRWEGTDEKGRVVTEIP